MTPEVAQLRQTLPELELRLGEDTSPWADGERAPDVVALPSNTGEAARVIDLANRRGWTIVPAGAGTWLRSRRAADCRVVVATSKLSGMIDYEPGDLTATVGAGATLAQLQAVAAPYGQWLPLDPPCDERATLGAIAALASAGPLRLGHGGPRNQVLGLQFVSGAGEQLRAGGRVVKNVAGYDLTRLLIGSGGALGLITGLHVRLRPRPEQDRTLAAFSFDCSRLIDAATSVRERGIEPVALELLSPFLARRIMTGPSGWGLLIRLQANAAVVEADGLKIRNLSAALGGVELVEADLSVWDRLGVEESRAGLTVRLADRPTALAKTLSLAASIATSGADAAIAAHAGDGIVRLLIGDSTVEPVSAAALATASAALHKTRGSLLMAGAPAGSGSAQTLREGLRRAFDPAGVLEPAP